MLQTHGMVVRVKGCLSQVLHFIHLHSAGDLHKALSRSEWLSRHHVPQKAQGHEAPVHVLRK